MIENNEIKVVPFFFTLKEKNIISPKAGIEASERITALGL